MAKSNVRTVKGIMENSKYGAIAEMFVIDVLMKQSELIAKQDPKKIDSGFVNGEAWVGVAKEIALKLEEAYGSKQKPKTETVKAVKQA